MIISNGNIQRITRAVMGIGTSVEDIHDRQIYERGLRDGISLRDGLYKNLKFKHIIELLENTEIDVRDVCNAVNKLLG